MLGLMRLYIFLVYPSSIKMSIVRQIPGHKLHAAKLYIGMGIRKTYRIHAASCKEVESIPDFMH